MEERGKTGRREEKGERRQGWWCMLAITTTMRSPDSLANESSPLSVFRVSKRERETLSQKVKVDGT